MNRCAICKNNSFHDGCCDHCGRNLGNFSVMIPRTSSRPNMILTDRYLVFMKGTNLLLFLLVPILISISLFPIFGVIGKIILGKPGLGIFIGVWAMIIIMSVAISKISSLNKVSDKNLLKQKSLGLIDITAIEKITVYVPKRKAFAGAVYFQFPNESDLLLGFNEQTGKTNIDQLISVFQTLGIQPEIKEYNTINDIRAQKPIADNKTLCRIVSQTAARFIKPFDGQIVLDF